LEDLIQEGNLGLLRALEKFDASRMSGRDGKHVRFLAYASHWVKALMSLAILEKGKIIKVNRNVQNKIAKMRKMDRQIETDLGRPATLAEVAVRLGIKVEEAEKLRRLQAFRFSSFDQPLRRLEDEHGDGEVTLYGLVAAEQPSAEHACSERMLAEVRHEALSKATAMLDPREQKILRERLLCDPVERKSQARLADEIGVSRGRIQQLEVRTKGKLRRLMRDDWDRAEGMGQS
jgi:RNA polymerase sigma factor (sigma-70 family)